MQLIIENATTVVAAISKSKENESILACRVVSVSSAGWLEFGFSLSWFNDYGIFTYIHF